MVRLKSRTQCPVNGFWVNVPETGFHQQYWSFAEAAGSLVMHARANVARFPHLPATLPAAEGFVDLQNAQRMQTIAGADSYIVVDEGPAPNFPCPQRPLPGNAAVVKAGAGVLLDWLGSGGDPVPGLQANQRAAGCAKCPRNDLGDWTRFFTAPVAALIRSQLRDAGARQLTTQYDESLQVCLACKCPLKLKVHVPLDHIARHLTPEVKARLDPACWILSELKQTNVL